MLATSVAAELAKFGFVNERSADFSESGPVLISHAGCFFGRIETLTFREPSTKLVQPPLAMPISARRFFLHVFKNYLSCGPWKLR